MEQYNYESEVATSQKEIGINQLVYVPADDDNIELQKRERRWERRQKKERKRETEIEARDRINQWI